jgi:hypothetical protein
MPTVPDFAWHAKEFGAFAWGQALPVETRSETPVESPLCTNVMDKRRA